MKSAFLKSCILASALAGLTLPTLVNALTVKSYTKIPFLVSVRSNVDGQCGTPIVQTVLEGRVARLFEVTPQYTTFSLSDLGQHQQDASFCLDIEGRRSIVVPNAQFGICHVTIDGWHIPRVRWDYCN